MGAWGFGNFENDDALDWVYELEKAADTAFLDRTLRAVMESRESEDYLEAHVCCQALAAAEVVAALRGSPCDDLPPEVEQWAAARKPVSTDALIPRCMEAIRLIQADSELKELWEETDEVGLWHAAVNNLVNRLN